MLEPEKLSLTLESKSDQDKITLEASIDVKVRDLIDCYKTHKDLHPLHRVELYREDVDRCLNENATLGELGICNGETLGVIRVSCVKKPKKPILE